MGGVRNDEERGRRKERGEKEEEKDEGYFLGGKKERM